MLQLDKVAYTIVLATGGLAAASSWKVQAPWVDWSYRVKPSQKSKNRNKNSRRACTPEALLSKVKAVPGPARGTTKQTWVLNPTPSEESLICERKSISPWNTACVMSASIYLRLSQC